MDTDFLAEWARKKVASRSLWKTWLSVKNFVSEQARSTFSFNRPRRGDLKNLSKRYTNKEIVSALVLTEPAVKEAMKRIMQKTKARTGILVEILGL